VKSGEAGTGGGFLVAYGTALGAAAVILFFAATAPNFASLGNLLNILKQISYLTILALGFSLALIAGELDLSFAHVASLAAVCCGALVHGGHAWPLGIAAALGVGLAFGAGNGLIVTRLKVPSLIATLATGSIALGFAFMISQGVSIVGRWPEAFLFLGRGAILGLPMLVWWIALAVALCLFLLKQTVLGIHMIATGEADEAARLAGIAVRRAKVIGLALSGLAAGVVAVLLTSSLSSASATIAGDFLLTAIAAVLLGMTTVEPGRPNVWGTVVGAVTIGVLGNGLVLLGAPYYVQYMVLGVIIIGAVSVSSARLSKAAFGV
jgi:ribose transport system permease protein